VEVSTRKGGDGDDIGGGNISDGDGGDGLVGDGGDSSGGDNSCSDSGSGDVFLDSLLADHGFTFLVLGCDTAQGNVAYQRSINVTYVNRD
jgi:hypothetical protein